MSGLIFVSSGAFSSPEGLPKIPVARVSPISGSIADWAADRLADGAVEKWVDLHGTYSVDAPSGAPHQWPIATEGALGFDGENDRSDVSGLPATQPKTVALVARFPTVAGSTRAFSGGTGGSFDLGINTNASYYYFSAGSNLMSHQAPDANWHVFVVVANGANSVLSVDGVEKTGNAGSGVGATIRVGATTSAYSRVDIRRLAILPYAAGEDERAALVSQLSEHYGLT